MITVNVNIVLSDLSDKLKSVDTNTMLRVVASNVLPEIRHRVHVEGKDSNESSIGTYSKGYMKVRTGNYPETVITRGKNKGQFREKKNKGQAGVFTKGKSKGTPRPVYNRTTDTDVILSLTRQMENDMIVIQTDNGYGIGYSNELNYNKAIWNEARYKKEIWNLSERELETVKTEAENFINKELND